MIRYAVFTPSLSQPGGAERHVYALIAHADPARLACTGVLLGGRGRPDPDLCRLIRAAGVPLYRGLGAPAFEEVAGLFAGGFSAPGEALRAAAAGAHVLVTWGRQDLAALVAGLGLPVVSVSHGSGRLPQPLTGVTHLVAVSRAARGAWPPGHGLPEAVLPNGVEVEHCVPRRGRAWQRAQWGLSDRQVAIGYVGRQDRVKRPWACLRALTALPQRFAAVLVGNRSGVDEPWPLLARMARDWKLAHRVRFVGKQAAMGDAYAGLDCLMAASEAEADSLAIKEAMLCGLPVCATRVGAIPEMEEEFGEVAAVVADPESGHDLAEAVYSAVGGDGRRRADRMRRVAWDRWTAPAMAGRWADYLERITDEHRTRAPAGP